MIIILTNLLRLLLCARKLLLIFTFFQVGPVVEVEARYIISLVNHDQGGDIPTFRRSFPDTDSVCCWT